MKHRLLSVAIDPVVVRKLERLASAALPKETGGVLLGYISSTRSTATVHVAGGIEIPDPDATRASYRLDPTPAETAMKEHLAKHGLEGEQGYVGDWHTHPANQPASGHDLETMFRAATGRRYPFTIAVLSWDGDRWNVGTHVSTGHWWWRRWR
jgi:hypothetical protein